MRRSVTLCFEARRSRDAKHRRGISLLEIVLSVAIFMLGFAGNVSSLEI